MDKKITTVKVLTDIYNDFNESSPGMMMIELSAYVGDVLSYYLDYQFKENLIQHASEKLIKAV